MPNVPCRFSRSFAFEPAATVLLAIDMQRDFLEDGGYCAAAGDDVSAGQAIVPRFAAVLAAARQAGLRVVHTREGYLPDGSDMSALKRERDSAGAPGPLGRFLIRGEPGQEIVPELTPQPGETAIDKPGFSAFYRTDLEALLAEAGITHLIVMGVTTQCCVHSTLRSAVDRGFRCLTVEDCCAALEPGLHDAAMSLIYGENHLFGWVCQSEDLIGALRS
ncbi:MAG: cysteine hydrolase family protein [Hyphomicrobiales bacterium]